MDYKNSNIEFLEKDLIEKFEAEKATELYQKACSKLTELAEKEQKYDNEIMNTHVFCRILPAMALYFTFIDSGYSKEEARELVLAETQKNARRLQEENKKMTKLPFTYSLFKMFVKSHMKKNFPSIGWDIKWIEKSKKEIHFDMTRCIYYDMCKKYDCPELCEVFCKNDITAFKGYLPKIGFERTGTIGEGKAVCDFHYINNKKRTN